MIYIELPDRKTRRLSFYLAMEEYAARRIDEQDCFFMWQVEPSVIFGRNQLVESEVNLEYCRTHGIQTYRRKSGGGCVYADMSNVMFSYITKDEAVGFTFNRYINMVVLMLRKLGVEAHASGRNDIMIGDRKVSGSAFYHIPGRSIVHGTMLYDTDMANMAGAITPSDDKLLSKGIRSVRQRIALLKDYTDITLGDFKAFVRRNLCDGSVTLTPDDVAAIEDIEREYLTPEFIFGKNPAYTVVRRRRIEGVGGIEVRVDIRGGMIKGVALAGDYLLAGESTDRLTEALTGLPLDGNALDAALPNSLCGVIRNLNKKDFISVLTED